MVEDYYEHNEREYKDYMKTYPPGQAQNVRVANILVERLKGLRFKTVFEIGCGYCLMTRFLINNFENKTYVCMDLSEDQVKLAKNYVKWYISKKMVKVLQGDIIHYRSGNEYDLVFCTTVLSHIPEQYIDDAVKNVCALSKKHIAIIEPTTEVIPVLKKNDDQWLHNYKLLFLRHGWGIVDKKGVQGFPIQYLRFEKLKED